jgi:hypothetical protein
MLKINIADVISIAGVMMYENCHFWQEEIRFHEEQCMGRAGFDCALNNA